MYADLKGELPTSIDDLASLTSLELGSNSITKTKDLYRMPALQVLDLSGNPLAPHSGYWRNPGSVQGSVTLPLCTTAHPLHTRFANTSGASISEPTM